MERITYQDVPSGMFENLMAIENSLNNSVIDIKLLELIRLRASQKNGCSYCVDMHYKELKHLGETELRLSSLCVWENTPFFSEKERAILALTESLTYIDASPLSNEMHHTLATLFSKEEICYIALAISQINTWNRLMKVFEFTPGNYKVNH